MIFNPSQAIFIIKPKRARTLNIYHLREKLNVHSTIKTGYLQFKIVGITYRISRQFTIFLFINFRKLYSQESIRDRVRTLLHCVLNASGVKPVRFTSKLINVQGSISHSFVNFEKFGRILLKNNLFLLDRSSQESESFRSLKFVASSLGTFSLYRSRLSLVTKDFTSFFKLRDLIQKVIESEEKCQNSL